MKSHWRFLLGTKVFFILAVLTLTLSFYYNQFNHLSNEPTASFDEYSNSMMISTMNFVENFPQTTSFAKKMSPETVLQNGTAMNAEMIKTAYINNTSYAESEYSVYYSNIMVHRFFYQFIDQVIPISKASTLQLLYGMNAVLLAFVVSCILLWLKDLSNVGIAYLILLVICLFSPDFTMIGTNLYWASWSLFLPMAGAVILVKHFKGLESKKGLVLVVTVSFLTCLIKQLIYFEFVSSVMIAMMIPYIGHCIEKRYSWKGSFKIFLFSFFGAISSFFMVIIIKFFMLLHDYGSSSQAIDVLWGPISYRLLGEASSANNLISESASASIFGVLVEMGIKPAVSISHFFWITQGGVVIALLLVSVFAYVLWGRHQLKPEYKATFNKIQTLLITAWISIAAPLSWFVLAKPHTKVHHFICTLLWFVPFTLLALTAVFYFVKSLYTMHGAQAILENNRNKRKDYIAAISTIAIVALGVILLLMRDMDNVTLKNKVVSEGTQIVANDNIRIYFYNNQLYFIKSRNDDIKSRVYLHLIPKDVETLAPQDKYIGFKNLDFAWSDKQIKVPVLFNFKMASQNINVPFVIDQIEVGQFNEVTGLRLWEEKVKFLQDLVAPSEISAANLTDANWERGISKDGNKLLVSGGHQNFKALIGKTIILSDKSSRVVTQVDFIDDWMHITVNSPITSDNGYPNKIIVQ